MDVIKGLIVAFFGLPLLMGGLLWLVYSLVLLFTEEDEHYGKWAILVMVLAQQVMGFIGVLGGAYILGGVKWVEPVAWLGMFFILADILFLIFKKPK